MTASAPVSAYPKAPPAIPAAAAAAALAPQVQPLSTRPQVTFTLPTKPSGPPAGGGKPADASKLPPVPGFEAIKQPPTTVASYSSPPPASVRIGPPNRQASFKIAGGTRLDSTTNTQLSSASVKVAPQRSVDLVSRSPAVASQGTPPSALRSSGAGQGPAHQLTKVAASTVGTNGFTGIPKVGPPAVAVGRAVQRGTFPAVTQKNGKVAARISKKYQFVFVTAEVAPWSKTGGLGEAMDGLPIALAALGHRVMTIAPRYDQYEDAWDTSYWSEVKMGSSSEPVHAFHAYQSKVDRVFVDHECFLAKVQGKTGSMLYGPEWGKDYPDNQWRFAYFAKAALLLIKELSLNGAVYGGEVIIFINDWHAALLPVFLQEEKKADPGRWSRTKAAMIIHNALFQGRFDRDDPEQCPDGFLNLPESVLREFTMQMPLKVGKQQPKVPRCLNWMAGGVKASDKVLTVSPTYAWELISLPEKSVELEAVFRAKGVTGILNGAKETISPQNELFVRKAKMLSTFGPADVDSKKAELKAYLQERYGLPKAPQTALCVFLGRMDMQKGYDYLLAALEAVLPVLNIQIVVVGTGRADLVASSKALAKKYPSKMYLAGWMGPERYALVAGADYMLMPSRWEPCGLAQIESMRFGTLPVVAKTGGLIDTVDDMVTGIHLGGALSDDSSLDPKSVDLMVKGLEKCSVLVKNVEQVSMMRKAAMAAGKEYTWSNSALQYETVADELGVVDVLPLCKDQDVTLETDKVIS